jgi:hypothetical protein
MAVFTANSRKVARRDETLEEPHCGSATDRVAGDATPNLSRRLGKMPACVRAHAASTADGHNDRVAGSHTLA